MWYKTCFNTMYRLGIITSVTDRQGKTELKAKERTSICTALRDGPHL